MPLRDHFRPPLDDFTSCEGFHAQWPAMLVLMLGRRLPSRYVAEPRVRIGASREVDIATLEQDDAVGIVEAGADADGVSPGIWAPAEPTLVIATDMPAQDEYEVRVYDARRGRRLVAAIEIISPANKDRPEHRHAFVAKCAALLQNQVSVTIVDLVTTRNFNLYGELLDFMEKSDPALDAPTSDLYAVACRATKPNGSWQVETWLSFLQIGQPLPTLPLWLAGNFSIPLELEESYEDTCKALRIP